MLNKVKTFLKGPTLYAFGAGVVAGAALTAFPSIQKYRDAAIAKIGEMFK